MPSSSPSTAWTRTTPWHTDFSLAGVQPPQGDDDAALVPLMVQSLGARA